MYSGIASLRINDANLDDSGTYRIKVENSAICITLQTASKCFLGAEITDVHFFKFRPDFEDLPEGDEVHVPQVRPVRNRDEARRPLRPPAQHHQRKDLHLPLVLVSSKAIKHSQLETILSKLSGRM